MSFDRVQVNSITNLVTKGTTPTTLGYSFVPQGIPFLRIQNIKEQISHKDILYIDDQTNDALSRSKIQPGDFLITIAGTIGKCTIVGADEPSMNCNQAIAIIRFKSGVDTSYFKHWIRSNDAIAQITGSKVTATISNLSLGKIKDLKIPLPSLEEQKRIAAILDKADALRQKRREAIAQCDELLKSTFLHMFGDPVTNPKGWEVKPMGKIMTIVRGGSPRPITKFLGGSYPWIKIGDATKGDNIYLHETKEHIIEEGLKKTRLLPSGSLIFANCGVSLGFARIITFEGCIHDGWLAFSDMDEGILNKIFILKTLNSITQYFRDIAPDGTQPNLNTSIMKNFNLIMPPIDLQNKFAEVVQKAETTKARMQASLKELDDNFNALMQKAFKGEL